MRSLGFALLGICLLSPRSLNAAPPTPATLFPAGTLLYLEVHQPGPLAREIAEWCKGSVLEDPLPHIHRLRESANPGQIFEFVELGMFGTLLGPEMVAELQRMQALGIGLTGFDKNGQAEIVSVLMTGESNLAGLMMRAYLSSNPEIRRVGIVEGVGIYQEDPTIFQQPVPFAPGQPAPKREPIAGATTYAMLPGMLIIGNSHTTISEMIRRAKEKTQTATLDRAPGFAGMESLRQQPGLLLYCDVPTFYQQCGTFFRSEDNDIDAYGWELLRNLIPPQSTKRFCGALSFDQGAIDLRIHADLVAGQVAPLFDFLSGKSLPADRFQRVPNGSWFAFSMSLPAEKRWQKFITLADAIAKANGDLGPLPSEAIAELEARFPINIGKSIIERVDGITVMLPQGTAESFPVLIVHTDAEVAEAIEGVLPTLLGLLGDAKWEPITETIAEQKLRSYPTKAKLGMNLHIGRKEGMLFIGGNNKAVAAAMIADREQSILSNPTISTPLKNVGNASLIGLFQWGKRVSDMLPEFKSDEPTVVEQAKTWSAWRKELAELPPLLISLNHEQQSFRIQVRQRDVRPAIRRSIDVWFQELQRSLRDPESLPGDR